MKLFYIINFILFFFCSCVRHVGILMENSTDKIIYLSSLPFYGNDTILPPREEIAIGLRYAKEGKTSSIYQNLKISFNDDSIILKNSTLNSIIDSIYSKNSKSTIFINITDTWLEDMKNKQKD